MLNAEPPAVNEVGAPVIVVVSETGVAIVHSLKLEPAYDPEPTLESTTSVVKVPRTGGELAAEVGPVSEVRLRVVLKPGGRPVPVPSVHCSADVEYAPGVGKLRPHAAAVPVNVHPVGAITEKDVIEYAFEDGLVTVTLNAVATPPIMTSGSPTTVGGLPLAVGLLMAAPVRAPPVEAKAGKNMKELPTSSIATTRTDSLVVS